MIELNMMSLHGDTRRISTTWVRALTLLASPAVPGLNTAELRRGISILPGHRNLLSVLDKGVVEWDCDSQAIHGGLLEVHEVNSRTTVTIFYELEDEREP